MKNTEKLKINDVVKEILKVLNTDDCPLHKLYKADEIAKQYLQEECEEKKKEDKED